MECERHMLQHACKGQRTGLWNQLSLSTFMCAPEIELGPRMFRAGALIPYTILSAWNFLIKDLYLPKSIMKTMNILKVKELDARRTVKNWKSRRLPGHME